MVTVASFHEAFLKAEEEAKFAELIIDGISSEEDAKCAADTKHPRGVIIPAINELRYAGKHLSSAIQDNASDDDNKEHLRRGMRHCIRARLDALKATILFIVKDFHQFTDDYRLLNIPLTDRNRFGEYRDKIWGVLSTFSQDDSQNTEDDCEKLKATIKELHVIYTDISSYRGKFNQLIDEIKYQGKISTSQWRVGILIGIAVGIISFLAGKFLQ